MYPSGRLWDYTQLSNILAETASNSQDEGGKIKDAMKKFIDKYSKLAIKADPSENCFTLSKRSDSIQKVPGKEIYLVKTDITIKGNTSCTKPFTIVQTDGNIIIE